MKRILFVGQAPPETMEGTPFKTTGLFKWLASVGIRYEPRKNFPLFHNQEGVFFLDDLSEPRAMVKFSALYDRFPGHHPRGGHLAPTPEQIAASLPTLRKLISRFKPDVIIPVGKLSAQQALGQDDAKLDTIIGKEFVIAAPYGLPVGRYRVIPLPHPSGVSTWQFQPRNKPLLRSALQQIRAAMLGKRI